MRGFRKQKVSCNDLEICDHYDVYFALLHGDIQEDVFIVLPNKNETKKVDRLAKIMQIAMNHNQ